MLGRGFQRTEKFITEDDKYFSFSDKGENGKMVYKCM